MSEERVWLALAKLKAGAGTPGAAALSTNQFARLAQGILGVIDAVRWLRERFRRNLTPAERRRLEELILEPRLLLRFEERGEAIAMISKGLGPLWPGGPAFGNTV